MKTFFAVIVLSTLVFGQVDSTKIKQMDSTLAVLSRTILDASNTVKLKEDFKRLLEREIKELNVFINRQYGYYTAKKEEKEKLSVKK